MTKYLPSKKLKKPLLVYFTEEEREALKRALTRHAHFSGSDLVRWLVVQYAEGKLVAEKPPRDMELEFAVRNAIGPIALEVSRLSDVVRRLSGNPGRVVGVSGEVVESHDLFVGESDKASEGRKHGRARRRSA